MMTDREALDILRAQGYGAGAPDVRTGRVRIWLRGSDEPVAVVPGGADDLAEGRLTVDEVRARREDETVIRDE